MTIKTLKTAACAGALMSAVVWSGGAFAAGVAGDFYDFESGTFDSMTGLSGNGSIATVTHDATSRPMPAAANTKVLEIAGTVVYTNATISSNPANASQVDFLFKVEPTDELENIDDGTVQVALAVGVTNAVGNTAPIKLWCKEANNGAAGWQTVLASAATGSWIRATLVMDYTGGTCKVSFNNDFAATKYLAYNPSSDKYVKSITMVGSTLVDELVITNSSLEAYNPYKDAEGKDIVVPAADGIKVTAKYLNDYGIKDSEVNTVKNQTSGMTVAQKFAAGLDPNSATQFKLETMQTTANSVTVTFPGFNGNGQYTLKAGTTKGGSDVGTATSTQTSSEGECTNSATVDISEHANELLYFTVETH